MQFFYGKLAEVSSDIVIIRVFVAADNFNGSNAYVVHSRVDGRVSPGAAQPVLERKREFFAVRQLVRLTVYRYCKLQLGQSLAVRTGIIADRYRYIALSYSQLTVYKLRGIIVVYAFGKIYKRLVALNDVFARVYRNAVYKHAAHIVVLQR